MALKKKKVVEPQGKPVVSRIPIPVSDTALVIDLPDGQKLVVGNMTHGTVIEVATWRGTGRPDSRTNRMMLGMTNAELEETLEEQNEAPTAVEESKKMAQKILNPVIFGFKWLFNFKDYDIKGVAQNIKSLRESTKPEDVVAELASPNESVAITPEVLLAPLEPNVTSNFEPIEKTPEAKRSKVSFKKPAFLNSTNAPTSSGSKLSKFSNFSNFSNFSKSSKADDEEIEAWLDRLVANSDIPKSVVDKKALSRKVKGKPVSPKKSISKKAVVKPNKSKPKR